MWLQGDDAPTLPAAHGSLAPEGTLAASGGPSPLGESMSGADKVFYTTGRLTSEMVIKSAQMGVPIVVSRSGITQMGHEIAQRLGLCAIGRAMNKRFLCYTAPERLVLQPESAAG
jgi:FdhD protein